ncbi:MAG: nucleotide sugar epimerase [Solibacterales bacterium]|nr:nucleotide sugar epimerase [Bryobacterales bacterium]|tara:strand:- start:11021 stop:11998 length:978 start_codon:yes stop_codon:yes gene_type:complete
MSLYLISGIAGFIGSKVADLLLCQGHTVIGLDNLNKSYDVRLKYYRLEELKKYSSFSFYECDICDRTAMTQTFSAREPISAVLHLAARAGVRNSVKDPWSYFETNAIGTLNLLEFCRQTNCGKFVFASTSTLYGTENSKPCHEATDTNMPLSPYAASKKAAEALCYTYHHLHGLDLTILRYFTVYGPAGRPDMSIFRFVKWINEGEPVIVYGDGTQLRDFTFVDDIALGTVAALKNTGYEIVNLGSNRPVSINEIITRIEDLVGRKAQIDYRPAHRADVNVTWADISKASRLLNWAPKTTYERGLEQSTEWYRTNRNWASDIATC